MISPDWDLVYEGMSDAGFVDVKFVPQGDKAYKLQFTSQDNMKYNIPLVTTDYGELDSFQWGDDSKRLWFMDDTDIPKRDYFILTSDQHDDILNGADGAYTHVLRFDSVDDNNHILTFSDLASGQLQAVYDEDDGTGSLIVGGTTFAFVVDDTNGDESIMIDVDADGNEDDGDEALIVTKGGLIIDLGNDDDLDNAGDPDDNEVVLELTTLDKHYDTVGGEETIEVTLSDVAEDEELDVDVADGDVLEMFSVEGQDLERGMTLYGAVYELTDTDDEEDTSELSIMYPLDQREALVYVVAGDVTSSRTGSAAGTVETVKLEKINVGAAKLDSEIGNVWAQNLILVGGPCANQAAAQVMGVSAYNCADGFVEGKAMIKLYESNGKVAMLVAGYSAMDTRRASRVISDYEKYKTQLVGTEREIVGTTLTDITIQ
jgi:hypothetical protein